MDSCDAIWLERQFTEEEVVQASCGDKALGLRSQRFQTYKFVGCVYRILAKILANILKEVLGKVISQLYDAIVRERQILGSVLIAKKCVESRVVRHPWNFI